MFTLIILSAAVSGIPSSTWPILGTTKVHTTLYYKFTSLLLYYSHVQYNNISTVLYNLVSVCVIKIINIIKEEKLIYC